MVSQHARLDFVCGDTWHITGAISKSDGSVQDLSGATFRWAIVDTKSGSVLITASTSDYITVTDAIRGEIEILIPHGATSGISATSTAYDQLRMEIDDEVITVWAGPVQLIASLFK